jgi:hypothetical protein
VTELLQCLRDELVRRDYASSTIRSSIQHLPRAARVEPGNRASALAAKERDFNLRFGGVDAEAAASARLR